MIQFDNVTKTFRTPGGRKTIFRNATATFPTGRSVGLLGRNGAGKTTLMSMIGGSIRPDSGTIHKTGTVSWTVGFAGSFNRLMTGAQNTKFVARIYGVDTDELVDFVQDFAELGPHFHAPVHSYSSGMKSRLAFGISIGIPFDTYLVDEVTSVGDAAFKRKSGAAFLNRMKTAGAIVVTHSMAQIARLCDAGMILEDGQLTYYDDIHEAIAQHHINMGTTEDE
ncbi:ABC transporter ATP-binding protein [Loktanella sp. 3ANDIMAR09]|uniref:ABC transporter ATP-binding protein n=1 Tax=Loktanella sp. 3ANDIMAR09 TaxID=1225657 RepID=UPI0006FA8952|nr:ABC transporter ATP-binding protein [Loktanella sp. 3ANDIMAR09]KQI67147.1 ABC transporter ATP-binding protein [Loktanella sp. 3ANDIMAR09]